MLNIFSAFVATISIYNPLPFRVYVSSKVGMISDPFSEPQNLRMTKHWNDFVKKY